MTKNIEAILFDFDGTLVDSMGIWGQIDIEYLGRFGLQVPNGLQQAIEGMSFSETAEYFQTHFDIPQTVEEMKETWREMADYKYTHEMKLKQGVLEFLFYCQQQNYKLGIATSNSIELISNALQSLQISSYFQCIVTACQVGKGKPCPDVYLKAAEELEVLPENCLVFEDIIPGIQAGKAANMTVIAVDDQYSKEQKAEKMELADYFITDYRNCHTLVESIGKGTHV